MKRVIKYLRNPAFTEAEWSSLNPFLKKGETGYLVNGSNLVIGMKVGPGFWADLPLLGSDIYPYTNDVTNPIGDVKTAPTGKSLASIIRDFISPYTPPLFSNFTIKIGTVIANTIIKEIGSAVNGPVLLGFTVSRPENLDGATPIIVSTGGIFNNDGDFAYGVPINITLTSPLNPNIITVVTISLSANHTNGVTPIVTAQIKFYPKILFGVSSQGSMISGAAFMSIVGLQSIVTNNYKRDYSFTGGGYPWLALPEMLNPSNLIFTDVTNPNLPANFSFDDKGLLSINNGSATYNYQIFRATYNLINATVLRLS